MDFAGFLNGFKEGSSGYMINNDNQLKVAYNIDNEKKMLHIVISDDKIGVVEYATTNGDYDNVAKYIMPALSDIDKNYNKLVKAYKKIKATEVVPGLHRDITL